MVQKERASMMKLKEELGYSDVPSKLLQIPTAEEL